jgi:type II secretory pathway pseudopilin PulG
VKLERNKRTSVAAFTLAETIVAAAVMAIMFASFFGGLSLGLKVVGSARETLRATQILGEAMETIRLSKWDVVQSTNFTMPFNPTADVTNVVGSGQYGLTYNVQVTVVTNSSAFTLSESYKPDVKEVTAQLSWRSGSLWKTNEMKTFVARYGLQPYLY